MQIQNKKQKVSRKSVDFIDAEVDLSSDDSDDLDEQLQIISSNDACS